MTSINNAHPTLLNKTPMEELQRLFSSRSRSPWSPRNLEAILRLSGGDLDRAVSRIAAHDATGRPAEHLVRSLADDGIAPRCVDEHPRHRRDREETPGMHRHDLGDGALPSREGGRRRSLSSPAAYATSAADLFHHLRDNGGCEPNSSNANLPLYREVRDQQPTRGRSDIRLFDKVPAIIQVGDKKSCNHLKPRLLLSQEHLQAQSQGWALNVMLPQEVFPAKMPKDQNDILLRQLSSSSQGRAQLGTCTLPKTTRVSTLIVGGTSHKKDELSRREMDMINVQLGIIHSYRRQQNEVRRRSPSPNNLDDEALEFGIRESKHNFQEHCRQQDAAEKDLIEKAKALSLEQASATTDITRMEESMIDVAKRTSLVDEEGRASLARTMARPGFAQMEEELVRDVMRESLVEPHQTNEERLIAEVKRESLSSPQHGAQDQEGLQWQAFEGSNRRDSLMLDSDDIRYARHSLPTQRHAPWAREAPERSYSESMVLENEVARRTDPSAQGLLDKCKFSKFSLTASSRLTNKDEASAELVDGLESAFESFTAEEVWSTMSSVSDRKPPALEQPRGGAVDEANFFRDGLPLGGHFMGVTLPGAFRHDGDSSRRSDN